MVKVRLADIDAPESKQAFGFRSKQALSDLCFREDARLEMQGKDRYRSNFGSRWTVLDKNSKDFLSASN